MVTITSTNTLAVTQGLKFLVYGRSGLGKTRLALTCPRPLILSAEKGLLSLAQENIPAVQINNFKDLTDVHAWATKSPEARKYDTFVLDSVTDIAEVILSDAKVRAGRDPRKAYGEVLELTLDLLRDFRDLQQKHVYFIAKEEMTRDGLTEVAGPMMPGSKLGQQLPFFFDFVFRLFLYIHTDGQQYLALRTRPDGSCNAKDRSGKLAEIEPANVQHIIAKVMQRN